MHRGWLLLGVSASLAAAAVVAAVVGLSFPPFLLAAAALAGGSYACWSRASDHIVERVYTRVGVEPNPDGTVGDEGARAERSHSGNVTHEPRNDWDDPDDWPFDDPFWTGEGAETDGGTTTDRSGDRNTTRSPRGGATTADPNATGDGDGSTDDQGRASPRFVAPRAPEACEVLGVELDATPEELRAAYREQAKTTHPDRGGSEAAFKRVQWAYEYLREH